MGKTLFPYQQQAIDNTKKLLIQRRLGSGIIHFATGLGKTVTSIELVRQLFPLDQHRVWFTAPAIELVFQTHSEYKLQWPECQLPVACNDTRLPGIGIVMDQISDDNARLVIASVQTLTTNVMMPFVEKRDVPEDVRKKAYAMYPGSDAESVNGRERTFFPYKKVAHEVDAKDITIDDILVLPNGGVKKAPDSKRYTLVSERVDRMIAHGLPTVVIHDEAHHSVADGTLIIMQRLQQIAKLIGKPEILLIGLTATPMRIDDRAMANLYKCIIISRDFRWAQREGYLVPFAQPIRVFAKIDNTNHHTTFKRIHDSLEFVVKTWRDKGEGRPTAFFVGKLDDDTTAVESSKLLAAEFNKQGIPAVHMDGGQTIGPSGVIESKKERRKYFKLFMKGEIKVICNVAVLIEGVDLPPLSCIGLLRKVHAVQLTQIFGRGLRLFKGNEFLPAKKDMLILDYTGEELMTLPVGTLMGMKVDPLSGQFVDDPDVEDELMAEEDKDGIALADAIKVDGVVQGSEAAYTLATILSKSPGDWYHDDMSDSMSMPVGPKDTMVITVPHLTDAQNMQYLLEEATLALQGLPTEVKEFQGQNTDKLRQYIELFNWAKELMANFILWHVVQQDKVSSLPRKTWLAANPALDVLEAEAVQYAYQAIESQESALMEKGKRWKSKKNLITDPQKSLLASIRGQTIQQIDPTMSKADAARLITHLLSYRAVAPYFTALDKVTSQFKEYMI